VRETLLSGGISIGPMVFEFFTPGLFAICKQAGADFVLLDMEHSGVGMDTIRLQLAAARGTGVAPLVRVPGNAYHLIAPVLDAGAFGIMVPLIEEREQAEEFANACRYRPEVAGASASPSRMMTMLPARCRPRSARRTRAPSSSL
jgi:2-keto-3-deoxy-L-rhamnonate aldolase RhmA